MSDSNKGINGIPITLKTGDGQVEKACFATARKCPELLERMKAIQAADLAETVASRKAVAASQRLEQCPVAELDAAAQAAQEAQSALAMASQSVYDAVREFVLAGFRGAGYTDTDAERLAEMVDPERLPELKAKCLLGLGRVDFS